MPSPFEVLEIDRTASEETVHRAYRRRVKEVHPDHGGSAAEFRAVQSAYEDALADVHAAAETDPSATTIGPVSVRFLDYEVLTDREWALDDPDLFTKAAGADLEAAEYGEITVRSDQPLLQSVEQEGHDWPYSCRGGACANCAVAVLRGELSQPVNHVLPAEAIDRGIRLSCVGEPITEELAVVFNVKHLPAIADLRLPPRPADSR